MASRKPSLQPLTDDEGEVRELTAEDFAHFKPFSVLPEAEQKMLLNLRKRAPHRLTPLRIP